MYKTNPNEMVTREDERGDWGRASICLTVHVPMSLGSQKRPSKIHLSLVGKGINDNALELPVSDRLVDLGDVLTDGTVVSTGHANQAVDANIVESLEVLLSVHLDLQLGPDVLVQTPGLLEVLARWGGAVSAVEEGLVDLSVESGQASSEGSAEVRDAGDGQSHGWGGQEVIDEWRGASLSDRLHPVRAVHAGRVIELVDDGLEQLGVDDRRTEVGHEFLLQDFRDPDREFGLQSAEVER